MKIEYKNTFEEYLNYEKLRIKKNKNLRIFANFIYYGYILGFIYLIGYYAYMNEFKGKDFWVSIIGLSVILIAWIICIPKFETLVTKTTMKYVIKKRHYLIEKRTLEIDNDIIKITNSNNNSIIINKNDINDIVQIKNCIYMIPIKEKKQFYVFAIIPLNVFNDDNYKNEFLNLLNKFKNKALF